MAEEFARQCSIALRLVDAQASREQLRFREQREGLLHDLVTGGVRRLGPG